MAFVLAERVRETTLTTGTGPLDLAGATLAMRTFVAGIGTGNTTRYCIVSGDGVNWEIGTGTVTDSSPDTLSRTPEISSNSNAAISLTGESRVFCVYPASLDLLLDTLYSSTRGSLLYRGASAWLARAPGSLGDVLTMGANDPAWAAPSAPAMVLIQTLTAASSSNLDFTSIGSYKAWKLIGTLLVPAVADFFALRFGTGGTPTYATTNYNYETSYTGGNGGQSFFASDSASQLLISVGEAAATPGVSFDLTIMTDQSNFVGVVGTSWSKSGDTHFYRLSIGYDGHQA